MADLRRKDLFNQRREASVGVFNLVEAEVLDNALVATLPARVLVTKVETIVHTASGTTGANITASVNGTDIATDVAVDSAGVETTSTPGYFATGGDLVVKPGSTAPADGALVCEVVVHYVDLDCVEGDYIS